MHTETVFITDAVIAQIQTAIIMRPHIQGNFAPGFIGKCRADDIDSAMQGIHAKEYASRSADNLNTGGLLKIGFKQLIYVAESRASQGNTIL